MRPANENEVEGESTPFVCVPDVVDGTLSVGGFELKLLPFCDPPTAPPTVPPTAPPTMTATMAKNATIIMMIPLLVR